MVLHLSLRSTSIPAHILIIYLFLKDFDQWSLLSILLLLLDYPLE